MSRLDRLRQAASGMLLDGTFTLATRGARLLPLADPARHGVEFMADVAYRPTGNASHRLDIYRPRKAHRPLPIVFYVHGGGFRILSKNTHWMMGLGFARMGYLTFNINYRLAPKHPYPQGLIDVFRAYQWMLDHAADYGGDPTRIAVAGESAGANLTLSLAIASCYRRPESFAAEVFERNVVPRAAIPNCGMFEVSNCERYFSRSEIPTWVADRMKMISRQYLEFAIHDGKGGIELANPVTILERKTKPERPLPPMFASVGTKDPVLDDTRRLKAALDHLGVECEDRYYEGELHAFQALVFRKNSRDCWKAMEAFLARTL